MCDRVAPPDRAFKMSAWTARQGSAALSHLVVPACYLQVAGQAWRSLITRAEASEGQDAQPREHAVIGGAWGLIGHIGDGNMSVICIEKRNEPGAEFAARTCVSHLEQETVTDSTGVRNGTWKRYYYHCPGIYFPEDYTECCGPEASKCCPPDKWFYEIDNTLATAIAVSVTLTCFALTILVIVCCFWSRCPLYNACRSRYDHDIPNHKSEELVMETVPVDSPANKKKYAPLASMNGSPILDSHSKGATAV